MRLIDADALLDAISVHLERIEQEFDDAPTIETETVRRGKWIRVRDEEGGNVLYKCSVCCKSDVHVPTVKVSYCWNCGARMDGGAE